MVITQYLFGHRSNLLIQITARAELIMYFLISQKTYLILLPFRTQLLSMLVSQHSWHAWPSTRSMSMCPSCGPGLETSFPTPPHSPSQKGSPGLEEEIFWILSSIYVMSGRSQVDNMNAQSAMGQVILSASLKWTWVRLVCANYL